MSMDLRMGGYRLCCNKCGRIIRADILLITEESAARLAKKFKACPRCLEARMHRDSKPKHKLSEDRTHEDSRNHRRRNRAPDR